MPLFRKRQNAAVIYDHGEAGLAFEAVTAGGKKKEKIKTLPVIEKEEQDTIDNSPFLNAKKRHMDIYLGQMANVAQWRLISFVLLILMALSVAGNIYMSANVKVQPFVVQVDEHGYAIPIQMAEVSGVDERVISAQIGQFIMNSRIRVMDRDAQIIFARNAFKSVGGDSSASRLLNTYFSKNPPTLSKEAVKVDMKAIIPLTTETYQAEWSESTTNDRGQTLETLYQGVFEIAVSPPRDMANLVANPLGVYN